MREPDDERAGLRQAFEARSGAASEGCPEADLLWRAVAGDLAPAGRRAVVAHTASCPSCAAAWRLAREVASLAAGATTRETSPSRPRVARWPIALAAGAVIAVGAALLSERERGPSVYRQPAATQIQSLVSEGPLPRSRCVLRWSPGPDGSRYHVRVLSETLQPLDSARDLDLAEYRVPAGALAALPAGARFLWQVDLVLPGGEQARSKTFFARIE